ncbi:hypothetical protein KUV50_02335 [Membranicola marinus]|uniref:Uncharacterized protein n=1 Tax=Membranihabitans marinus TaxID=1227546 RepID=A0A953HUX1_9BACT|nr:hypothetical protein [Membranihabitans marinus]MBY5956956.1 hypothetical protein [Membranihabitans marinus]
MKKLIFFQLPPPGKYHCFKLRFVLPNLPRILPKKPTSIYPLLILMMSMLLFSCEDQEPVIQDSKTHIFETVDEILEYHSTLKDGFEENYIDVKIEDIKEGDRDIRPSLRSSLSCDLEVSFYRDANSSTDSATVEIYKNSSPWKSYDMEDKQKITVVIDDADSYQYKVTPLGDTSNVDMSLKAGLKFGTKTIFPGIIGSYISTSRTYTCPTPTGGICEINICTDKIWGNATGYLVFVRENGTLIDYYPIDNGKCKTISIDENNNYKFDIAPIGNGTNERYTLRLETPEKDITYTFTEETGSTNILTFDCP